MLEELRRGRPAPHPETLKPITFKTILSRKCQAYPRVALLALLALMLEELRRGRPAPHPGYGVPACHTPWTPCILSFSLPHTPTTELQPAIHSDRFTPAGHMRGALLVLAGAGGGRERMSCLIRTHHTRAAPHKQKLFRLGLPRLSYTLNALLQLATCAGRCLCWLALEEVESGCLASSGPITRGLLSQAETLQTGLATPLMPQQSWCHSGKVFSVLGGFRAKL